MSLWSRPEALKKILSEGEIRLRGYVVLSSRAEGHSGSPQHRTLWKTIIIIIGQDAPSSPAWWTPPAVCVNV